MTKNKISALYESDTDFRNFIHKHADDIYQEHNADLNINLTHEQQNKLNNNEIIEYGEYLLFKNSNNKIRQLIRLSEDGIGETDDFDAKFGFRKIRGDWWAGYYKDMGNINKEGGIIFKNGKKPIRLIKDLIKIATNSNDIILDFFAGSGTTAHAVMELNAEDKGNREFILVQIDEEIKEDESAYDFCKNVLKSAKPIISDITIERVKRAAQKIIQSSKDSGLDLGFKVYTLEDKAQITNDKEKITLFNRSDLTPFDKALNLALQCGKTLNQALEIIIKDKLYKCEDAYFCIVCDKEAQEYLAKSKNEMIFLDGYEEIDLQAFLNLNASFKERLSVVY
ncbi:DNA methyltransferase [Helicobacter pylori]|uniref:DNA methyltransferase n=1 Tax=Helicobacter pylori TaxID=210 RepID=UPI001F09199C|nr:DNA methyltransferase [Helicobacter pylori]